MRSTIIRNAVGVLALLTVAACSAAPPEGDKVARDTAGLGQKFVLVDTGAQACMHQPGTASRCSSGFVCTSASDTCFEEVGVCHCQIAGTAGNSGGRSTPPDTLQSLGCNYSSIVGTPPAGVAGNAGGGLPRNTPPPPPGALIRWYRCDAAPAEVAPAFPVVLQGAAGEEAIVRLDASMPTGATDAALTLTVFDHDYADEGQLYVNGHGPIALFGSQIAGDAVTSDVVFTTPASWWFASGDNELRFVHTSTHGFRVDGARVAFIASLPPCGP